MKLLKGIEEFIKNNIVGFLLGMLIFGASSVLAIDNFLLNADDITYDNTGSGAIATDVESAIDELNNKADALLTSTYDAYSIGDTFTFNGDSYHIIEDSSTSDDYVVALKDTALSNTASSYGSDSAYATSSAKTAVDTWAASIFTNNELKKVNNYTARLVEVEELTALGCASSDCTNSSYSWIYNSNYTYFTMSQYNNTTTSVWSVGTDGSVAELATSSQAMLRPVINILKSAINS